MLWWFSWVNYGFHRYKLELLDVRLWKITHIFAEGFIWIKNTRSNWRVCSNRWTKEYHSSAKKPFFSIVWKLENNSTSTSEYHLWLSWFDIFDSQFMIQLSSWEKNTKYSNIISNFSKHRTPFWVTGRKTSGSFPVRKLLVKSPKVFNYWCRSG